MHVATVAPCADHRATVLVCPPLFRESGRNRRREYLLARTLAQAGFLVVRFDYRGTGESVTTDGSDEIVGTEQLVRDAIEVLDGVVTDPLGRCYFVGTRLGAWVALGVAQVREVAGVVLWDPVFAGATYVRELLRSQLLVELRDSANSVGSNGQMLRQLDEEGFLDILGSTLTRALVGDVVERDLAGMLGSTDCRTWVARLLSHPPSTAPVHLPATVSVASVLDPSGWWFHDSREWSPDEDHAGTKELLTATVAKLVSWDAT